jgi:segregation and condensation protein A
VRLDAFEGPLDLLLFLIKREEVDVHDIAVSGVTEQYLEYLRLEGREGLARIDIDTAGEFLVMAATLMEIKSRMLLPTAPKASHGEGQAAAEDDPRSELVRQLLEYKKYRDAADSLERRGDEWRARFGTAAAAIDDDALRTAIEASANDTELEDLDLLDLVEAFQKITETVNFDRLGEHQVTYDDTPLELHAEDILDRLRRDAQPRLDGLPGEIAFVTFFKGRRRGEMVGLFLALLELCRRRAVAFRHGEDGQLQLRVRTSEEVAADQAAVNGPMGGAGI